MPLARVDAAASRRVGARSRPGATFCRRAGRSLSRALVGAALKEGRRVSGTSRHLCCTCKRREGPAAVSVCPARWGLPRATAALSGRSRTGGAQAEETGRERRRPATEKGAREAGVAREGGMGSERDLGGDAECGGKANMHTERGEMQ